MKQLIQTINKWKYKRYTIQPIFQLITTFSDGHSFKFREELQISLSL